MASYLCPMSDVGALLALVLAAAQWPDYMCGWSWYAFLSLALLQGAMILWVYGIVTTPKISRQTICAIICCLLFLLNGVSFALFLSTVACQVFVISTRLHLIHRL